MTSSLPSLPFGQVEYSIHEPIFKLYGEDLRCLDSGRPMCVVFRFNKDINDSKSGMTLYDLMVHEYQDQIDNADTFIKRCLQIVRIGENEFKYDTNRSAKSFIFKTDLIDPEEIYNLHNREMLVAAYISTNDNMAVVCFNHAIYDGVSSQASIYRALGKTPVIPEPILPPALPIRTALAARMIASIPWLLKPSQTSLQGGPRFEEMRMTDRVFRPEFATSKMSISQLRKERKQANVPFVAMALSSYITRVFDNIPDSIDTLMVYVSAYMLCENRFNNYSVVPIELTRGMTTPKHIVTELSANQWMVYGFHELFKTDLLTSFKTQVLSIQPDVIFSCMKNNEETGVYDLSSICVRNHTSKANIYACAIQCGVDNFLIETSSQTPLLDIDGLRDVQHEGDKSSFSTDYTVPWHP